MTNSADIKRRGLLLVLSSPSGAGKTTLSRRLLEDDDEITMSVSVTTRPMRPGEIDGEDYIFVDPAHYHTMVNDGDFLEHARVFDHAYGTPRAPVMAALEAGRDVLFDIDWQGTQLLRENVGHDLVTVFILPPSTTELEKRLRVRAQDHEDVVKRRMGEAASEMSHWSEYDYVIINDDLDDALGQLKLFLAAERQKRARQSGLAEFVHSLS